MSEQKMSRRNEAHVTVQRLTIGEPYVFSCGEYVLSPAKNGYNNKLSYWITKKAHTAAFYCFSVCSMDYPHRYEKEIKEAMGCTNVDVDDLRTGLKQENITASMDKAMQSYIFLFDESIKRLSRENSNQTNTAKSSLGETLLQKILISQKEYHNLKCPRCGLPTLNTDASRNSRSRYAPIWICDVCGVEEALEDTKRKPVSFQNWALVKNIKEYI